MSFQSSVAIVDGRVRALLQAEIARAIGDPALCPLVLRAQQDLRPRVVAYYRQLCALPRRTRRALQRQWKRSLTAIALLMALGQAPGLAATIMVAPATPPDINDDDKCALIEAIVNANNDSATHDDCPAGNGADTIEVPAGSTQTLTSANNSTYGATGLPVITRTITITTPDSPVTITRGNGAPPFRIFAVGSGEGNLTLQNTTVSGGNATDGAGLFNSGVLTLEKSTVSGNSASGDGGGVNNYGTVNLSNSTVSGNSASGVGGGVFNRDGTVNLSNSTVSGNSASSGGGVYSNGYDPVNVYGSTISGNSASERGGGVDLGETGHGALTNTTVSGNIAGKMGGGVSIGGDSELTITHCTIFGNSADEKGGGVHNTSDHFVVLDRTLVSGNTAIDGPEIFNLTAYFEPGDVYANRFNLFGHDGTAGVAGFTPGPTDVVPKVALSAILNPTLVENEFEPKTRTHRLVILSPAVNAIPAANCAPPLRENPSQGRCDIGAVEFSFDSDPCAAATPTAGCTVNGVPNQLCQGTSGNDKVIGTDGPDVILGQNGNDFLQGRGGRDLLCGGEGSDRLTGGTGDDELYAGGGIDVVRGGTGNDAIEGGEGNGDLNGNEGDDFIVGGSGDDEMEGGAGADILRGLGGNDVLQGQTENDELSGDGGADRLNGGPDGDTCFIDEDDVNAVFCETRAGA